MSRNRTRTKADGEVLFDAVRESPVDRSVLGFRRALFWIAAGTIAVLVLGRLEARLTADRPIDYETEVDHFKYGSIGSEPGGSLLDAAGGLLPPRLIFQALPEICPEKIPGGWESLGLLFEDGKSLPIGVSRRFRLGIDQVGLNCAVCHTGTVRETPTSDPEIVLGMPAHQLLLQDFFRFVLDCTLDSRFTPDKVLGTIESQGTDLSWLNKRIYAFAVRQTREQTLQLSQQLALLMGDQVTEWGAGRVDTFNPYKSLQFNWRLDQLPIGELTAASDYPSLWNQKPRDGMELHWDGNNDSVDERNLSASLGAGVTPVTIDHKRLQRVRDWIWTLPPPPYPYSIDQTLATQGEPLYRAYCLDCHGDHRFKDGIAEGSRLGKVEPIDAVGTDRHRLDSYTYTFAANQYTLYPDSEYRFTHFHKTAGYANQPLDGIWARAPYLHNGSVPTLRYLLEPPESRPQVFYRGYDVFDQEGVGFVHDVPEENGRSYFRFDASLPGNDNSGHLWGTQLPAEQKDAIVEYMKTF